MNSKLIDEAGRDAYSTTCGEPRGRYNPNKETKHHTFIAPIVFDTMGELQVEHLSEEYKNELVNVGGIFTPPEVYAAASEKVEQYARSRLLAKLNEQNTAKSTKPAKVNGLLQALMARI